MRTIAIPFELDENWVGGSYYIGNLISAMKLLPEDRQIFVLLVSERPESVRFIEKRGYPQLGWVTPEEFDGLAGDGLVDVVFPHAIAGQEARTISWIPDFQELHLDYFFSDEEIARRRGHHRQRFATAGLIVSSEDVRKDIDTFYPGECDDVAVVRFASFDRHDPGRVDDVRRQYGLPESYVFCANQVWLHKNHIVVIRAIALLKEMGIDVTMVFTGNESDYRVADYASFLKRQVAEWGIADRVHFLGFIPRADQLCLMAGARYIVQPSLFEGWSTVIEDAKAMDKFIVASDLGVHKEQLGAACRFFFRHDPQALAEVMAELSAQATVGPLPGPGIDYDEARRRFAEDLIAALERFVPAARSGYGPDALDRVRVLSDANMERLRTGTFEADPIPEPTPAPPPAPAPVATMAMPGPRPVGFRISVEGNSDSYQALLIFSERPITMSRHYDKFMVKVVQVRGVYRVELRSGSISPALVTEDNSHGEDDYGHFLRIAMTPGQDGAPMTGHVTMLSAEALGDVNAAIDAGIAQLLQQIEKEGNAASPFLAPIAAGVELIAMV